MTPSEVCLRAPFVREMSGADNDLSTFADLVITGRAGIVPRADQVLVVNPLGARDGEKRYASERVRLDVARVSDPGREGYLYGE